VAVPLLQDYIPFKAPHTHTHQNKVKYIIIVYIILIKSNISNLSSYLLQLLKKKVCVLL